MSSDAKVSVRDNKIVIHRSVIREELQDKISDDDIKKSEELVDAARNKQSLMINILTNSSCSECTGLSSTDDTIAAPHGNQDADIVFVSKMPTVLECKTRLSHSDTVGHFLMLILSKFGINPEQFYYTNFVKCTNQRTLEGCWHCASSYFIKEIALVRPKIIVCEGLALLNVISDEKVFTNLPTNLEYGKIYDTFFLNEKYPIKVVSICDLNSVLQKQDADLQQSKNILWSQLTEVVHTVKNCYT